MHYKLYKDGCWDILGENIQIYHAYPAINGSAISPVSVSMGEDVLQYQLEEGSVKLRFSRREKAVEVSCTLHGISGIHDIEPIANAKVKGAENVFVQGFGMEGPSGCRTVGYEMLKSNGLISLYQEQSALFIYALDHRHYVNRYCVGKTQSLFADDAICLFGGFNLENTQGDERMLPSLFFTEEKTLAFGLQSCAEKIAAEMGARTAKPPVFHWCSWYYLYQNLSQDLLEEYLGGFQTEKEIPFRYIQIDAGYAPSPGDWLLPNHLFPEGLKKAAESIIRSGYEPGIWVAPFIVGDQSELFRKHPDWILYDLEGKPVTEIRSYNEPKVWGNRDSNYYVLDASHPEALAYLKEVFQTLKRWGFSLFKTDFMLWNMHDTSKVRRFDSSLTSVEIFRNTLKTIRQAIGEDSYLLGCIAPFLPFIGYADGMRIAGDVGAQWAKDYGPVNMIRELVADNYFNNIYWQNDPDSVLLRDFDIFLKPYEIRSLALLQALSGGAVTTSDPIHKISGERRDLLRFIMPKGKVRPQLPYFTEEREDLVLLHRLEQGNLLYAMNPTEKPLTVVYGFEELFGEKEWFVREYGNDASEKKELYTTVLKPHDSVLLFLTQEPLQHSPKNLWEW
ncbi:MAG: alpha-galactosidase [Ruminococcus sp.]|nr:alpha-galactosidase [Ruminococcus sp.]